MKIKNDIDLTMVITTLGFIVSMVVWGIRLEGSVSGNAASMDAYKTLNDLAQQMREEAVDKRMDRLRADITIIEQQLREMKP